MKLVSIYEINVKKLVPELPDITKETRNRTTDPRVFIHCSFVLVGQQGIKHR